MINANKLLGRSVIDMEAAERLGRIKEIILQRDGERVAGFIVARGESIIGTGGTRRIIPASALHSIGPDAVTVRGSAIKGQAPADLDNLPRMSDVIGHKMVTRSGRLLGSINDVLINGNDGTIIGFAVGEGVRNKLESIFSPERSRIHGYVRADAELQVGNDLIVVPDDALIEGEPTSPENKDKPGVQHADETVARGWGEHDRSESPRRSIWTRRTGRAATSQPPDAGRESAAGRTAEASRTTGSVQEQRGDLRPTERTQPVTTVSQDQSEK